MATSADVKNELIKQMRQQNNIQNTVELIQKMGGACFEKCLPGTPGSSLSKSETACVPNCTEKYIAAWNLVNSTIISRLQREAHTKGGSGFVDV